MFPENVTVIMGPSGAGKTSLLNVLLGKAQDYANVGGQVLLNQVEQSTESFRREVGFVPQDDIMHTELTVKETLTFQALLRLPPTWDRIKVGPCTNPATPRCAQMPADVFAALVARWFAACGRGRGGRV